MYPVSSRRPETGVTLEDHVSYLFTETGAISQAGTVLGTESVDSNVWTPNDPCLTDRTRRNRGCEEDELQRPSGLGNPVRTVSWNLGH